MRTVFEVSAGGVVYRRSSSDGTEVCLISTRGGTRWQLPKGKREPGESIEETAARKVDEAVWLTPSEALARLTFPSERRVLQRALALANRTAASRTTGTSDRRVNPVVR